MLKSTGFYSERGGQTKKVVLVTFLGALSAPKVIGHRWSQQYLFQQGLLELLGGSNAISSLLPLTPSPLGGSEEQKKKAGFL